jgi:hypothetical protein
LNDEKIQSDNCPDWAASMIEQLRQVEIFLGNIPKGLAWESSHLDEVSKRSFAKDNATFDEGKADLVFRRIVKGLHGEGFTLELITEFVNRRIGYKGGPKYCDINDVNEVVS